MPRLVVLLLLLPAASLAEITGKPAIIDGDTIEIAGQRIRFHGIDAPESKQTCLANGKRWYCGFEAEAALALFIAKSWVTCLERDRDLYGRIVATCYAGGFGGPDLGRWMVSQGWALAYRQYSAMYEVEEEQARAAHKGLWRGEFVPPWDWRRGKRLAAQTLPQPLDCPIKGNINSKGERIYHVPGGQWYDQALIDLDKGERWFCSEDEAWAAGWRPAGGNVRSDQEKRIDAHVGRRVRLRRTLLGMNQTALGRAVGVTSPQIYKYENGSHRIGAGRLFQFAEVLDVPVPFFFDSMPEEVAGRPPNLSDTPVDGGEADRMARRETLELVRAYYRISDPRNRRRAREFVKLISDLAAGAEAEGE